jgi:solute carrier family 35 protein F1/2
MASKSGATKTTAIETQHSVGNGESYRKSSDGLEGTGEEGGSMEMHAHVGEDGVDPEVLEYAIEALESKKRAWYAYLLTKDFWLVLLIGFVSLLHLLPFFLGTIG